MPISDIMELGRQGLVADRQALQTTSQNIANANTPGYSRQRPEFHAVPTTTAGGFRTAGGVEIKDVIRVHDQFVHNQLVEENKTLGGFKARSENLKRIESVIANEGSRTTDLLNGFFNNLRALSVNPETSTLRNEVMHSADSLASGFRSMSDQLTGIRGVIDQTLIAHVDEINSMARQLAHLNETIHGDQARGNSPNELLDKRDLVVRELSHKLGVQALNDDQGNVNVVAGGLGTLVNGNVATELVVQATPARGDKASGSVDVALKDANGTRVITHGIDQGEMGGLLHVRDQVINPALNHLNLLAYNFSQAVNEVHAQGVGADGKGERTLFNQLEGVKEAARLLEVNAEVKGKPDAIAVGLEPGKSGDNRIALKLADLQNEKVGPGSGVVAGDASGHSQTANESLASLIGDIGVQAHEDGEAFEHQSAIVSQLENYRQTVSGVSLEEEGVNLMKFQSSYNAAAKCMKIGDELFQTVLSIKQ